MIYRLISQMRADTRFAPTVFTTPAGCERRIAQKEDLSRKKGRRMRRPYISNLIEKNSSRLCRGVVHL